MGEILLQIKIIAPCGPFEAQDVKNGLKLLRESGFSIADTPQNRTSGPAYLNGCDADRLEELELALFKDEQANILWLARGGYGLTRILPQLDVMVNPRKIFVGFSDGTALLAHLWSNFGLKGVHAPNLNTLGLEDSASLQSLWAILQKRAAQIEYPQLSTAFFSLHITEPIIKGRIFPFNLCLLTHLIGTSSMPDLSHSILVLEEIEEPAYRVDRMLTQLWASKTLQKVSAIVLGHFTQCATQGLSDIKQVIIKRAETLNIPIFTGLPLGHEQPNWALPFGCMAQIRVEQESAFLQVLEEVID